MTESAFIAREQAKQNAVWLRRLTKVARYGLVGPREAVETMLVNGLMSLSPPRPGFKFNHYRLTDKGAALLAELCGWKGGAV